MDELWNKLQTKGIDKNLTIQKLKEINSVYPVMLSKYLKEEILQHDIPGVYKQFIPDHRELDDADGVGAFFADEKNITETMVQKYPNRCIIYLTSQCFANCRHCSRKENWIHRKAYSRMLFDRAYLAILERSYIEEVILTGGDVLTIPVEEIAYMLDKLNSLEHLRVIRLGTRAFTSNPDAITSDFCEVLEKNKSVVVCTQFNHPDEFSAQTEAAIAKVQKTGTVILNQSVLLKGINDDFATMKELLAKCASNRVIPYYLFHCFKVKGVQCYRTDVQAGIDLINKLVGTIGGWWIPRYTLIPHITGVKVPVCHNGIIKQDADTLFVQDFMGRNLKYE